MSSEPRYQQPTSDDSRDVRDALFWSLVEHSGRAKKYGYDLVDGLLADLRALPVAQVGRCELCGWPQEDHDA